VGLCLLVATHAHALTGGTNISVQNGAVSITGTIGVANGGTGVASWSANNSILVTGSSGTGAVAVVAGATSGNVLVSGGAGVAPTFTTINLASSNAVGSSILPIANGGTNASSLTSNRCLRFNGTAIVSASGDCATPVVPVVAFGSGMDLTTSQTVYAGLTGQLDATEGVVQTPSPAATYANLRCINSAIQGVSNNVAVTGRVGACGSQADGTLTCTITGSASANQACSDTSNTLAATAGQCVDFKIVTPAALSANARVNCTVERTV
jgi:hypothetical protein